MPEITLAMRNVYREHGYSDREDYLSCIAEDYGVDLEQVVRPLADLLGPAKTSTDWCPHWKTRRPDESIQTPA